MQDKATRKRAQEKARESETDSFTHPGIPQKHYTGSHNIYTEDQMQIQVSPKFKFFNTNFDIQESA